MAHAHDRRSPRHPDEDELVRAVDDSAALRQLLAAASAPPSTAELKGRSQAIAYFRAHRTRSAEAHAGTARPGRAGQPRLTRRSSARLTVACAALLTLLGGTAATAAAGEVPTALRNAVSGIFTEPPPAGDRPSPIPIRPAEHPLQPGPGRTAPTLTGLPSSTAGAAAQRPQAGATARQLAGLCRAYRARQAGASPAEVLARPGFGPLITAAGGAPKVAAFCAESVGAASRSAGPGAAATPIGRPTAGTRPTAAVQGHRRGSGAAPAAGQAKPAPQHGTGGHSKR
jgi:hypothetical protein